jgi:hypothetical protein
MAWSIFTASQGGGTGSAATWASDLLSGIGAPESAGNKQMVYDWEVSEGGGGQYNPLNVGPDPDDPGLALTGEQYGGGAADYGSWSDGLKATEDYLSMQNFSDIESSLKSNQPIEAETELWDSPWAGSHYGYGADWSTEPIPGKATALPDDGSGTSPTGGTSSVLPSWLNDIISFGTGVNVNQDAGAAKSDIVDYLERGALMLFGGILIIVGIFVLVRGPARAENAVKGAESGGAPGAAIGSLKSPGSSSGSGSLGRAAGSAAKRRKSARDKAGRDRAGEERHQEAQLNKVVTKSQSKNSTRAPIGNEGPKGKAISGTNRTASKAQMAEKVPF